MRTLPYRCVHRSRTCSRASGSCCSRPRGSTPATSASWPSRARTSPAASPTCRSWWCATARASCARSSTSAATAAPRSSPARGRCTTLQCHYHAWTYGLDGALRAAPRSDATRTSTAARSGLRRACGRHLGAVRVRQRRCGRRAAGRDARAAARHRPLRAGSTSTRSRSTTASHYGVDANWKVAIENYLECYHCAVAHPGFSDVVDVRPDAYELEAHPTFASHYGHARDGDAQGQFHLVWPALKFNVMPAEPPTSRSGRCEPASPSAAPTASSTTSSRRTPRTSGSPPSSSSTTRSAPRTPRSSPPSSAGWPSGAFEHGRLLLPSEELIAAFQSWVSAGLRWDTPAA